MAPDEPGEETEFGIGAAGEEEVDEGEEGNDGLELGIRRLERGMMWLVDDVRRRCCSLICWVDYILNC